MPKKSPKIALSILQTALRSCVARVTRVSHPTGNSLLIQVPGFP